MITAHTPGPWTVDPETHWVSGPRGLSLPANLSDGALMAAAPELLAALEHLVAELTAPNPCQAVLTVEVIHARAAIAKARKA